MLGAETFLVEKGKILLNKVLIGFYAEQFCVGMLPIFEENNSQQMHG